MGMKGKQAKEKLRKYMSMQNNESVKKEYILKYYRYAKLRYTTEDYFRMTQIHQQKFIEYAESDIKKAKYHTDIITTYTKRVERWLDELEDLHK